MSFTSVTYCFHIFSNYVLRLAREKKFGDKVGLMVIIGGRFREPFLVKAEEKNKWILQS